MKFSELSYREYLAIEFLPAFMRHYSALGGSEEEVAENTAKYAFRYADAFLRVVNKEYDKVAYAENRAARAETQVSLLLNMNDDKNLSTRVALLQLWEMLAADNQTLAVQRLRDLQERAISNART